MTSIFEQMSTSELKEACARYEQDVERLRALNLSLDMTRGKPSPEQVALSKPLLDELSSASDLHDGASDAANYGDSLGLPSARAFFAELLEVAPEQIYAGGSASLNIMFDVLTHAFVRGIRGGTPWRKQDQVRFLCPSPGYDRHFALTDYFGIEAIPVPMLGDGPDMDTVVRLVESDATIKGIWCVPKYQNPTGITFSDACVRRFAALKPAAADFRIFWDNAYLVHDFDDTPDELLNIFEAMKDAGTADLVYEFASTSKISFPGSGIACMAASEADLADVTASFSKERVCPDKISQLAHVRWLRDAAGVHAHMRKHATYLRPRFELVEHKLSDGLGDLGCARWTHPHGGYFVSFDGPEGTARATVALAAELGVSLTAAGATWPAGHDPADTNIRLAPTYPALDELAQALDVFVAAVRLVAARAALERRANDHRS